MNDLLKKGFYIGLGAAFASKEKAEKYVNDLIVKGELPQGEGRRILEELQEKGRGKQETWSAQFQKEIASSLKKLGFVTEERFRELEQQLQRLEAKLDNLVGQQEQGHLATQTNTAPDNAENDDESRS